tara:strand:+ start:335 stop:976 length:642 start_codon:yes stop_codon:yes gene_type:complete
MKLIFTSLLFLFLSNSLYAHTFTGKIGFLDGISHPVLGFDHFLAMVSVGIISSQFGKRLIWTIPSVFVLIMIIGGIFGISFEFYTKENFQNMDNNEVIQIFHFARYINSAVEYGIIFSVIFLGGCIAIEKKLPVKIIMAFVAFFGFCHGVAHGLEMPWAVNPLLFGLGFSTGTAILHIFGVIIGYFSIKSSISSLILRFLGMMISFYGIYLIF